MIRVINLEKSIDFYTKAFAMKIFKRTDYPDGKFTLAFLGYGESEVQIELTYNWEKQHYDMGDAFGHIALGVDDINKVCNDAETCGGKIVRAPGAMKFGTTVIAFIEDPDGYKIELIQNKK
jgi:lactoylglutathione lyase